MVKKRIQEIDALRGFAAVAVVLFHFALGKDELKYGFNIGFTGVDLFFIISGFVIFLSIQNSKDWKTFLWNRSVRLYPAYWVCVTITTLLIIFKNQSIYFTKEPFEFSNNILLKYAANMTMFNYYLKFDYIDQPYWTLTIELCFYLLIAFFLFTKRIKHIEAIGALLIFTCFTCSFDFITTNFIGHKIIMLIPIIKFFPLFYSGILLYLMKFEKITPKRFLLFLLSMIVQCAIFYNNDSPPGFINFYEYALSLICIYGVFILYLFNKLSFIINGVTIWLGKISYSLYLIHQYLGVSIILPFLMDNLGLNFWVSGLLALILLLVIATVIHRYIEKPALLHFKK
jgi:peptidoglycan/LPS O-acetylase OafA/YrhL